MLTENINVNYDTWNQHQIGLLKMACLTPTFFGKTTFISQKPVTSNLQSVLLMKSNEPWTKHILQKYQRALLTSNSHHFHHIMTLQLLKSYIKKPIHMLTFYAHPTHFFIQSIIQILQQQTNNTSIKTAKYHYQHHQFNAHSQNHPQY